MIPLPCRRAETGRSPRPFRCERVRRWNCCSRSQTQNPRRNFLAQLKRSEGEGTLMDHQSRHADFRQNIAEIDLLTGRVVRDETLRRTTLGMPLRANPDEIGVLET